MLSDFRAKISPWLDRGESVQIIAPSGFGKSRFGKSLPGLFIDPNLLQTPSEIVSAIRDSTQRRLIILDSFDKWLSADFRPVYKYLKGLRDAHKYQLAYVFLTHRPLSPEVQPLLGDLYELASEHVVYLPVLDPSEYDLFGLAATPHQLAHITQLSSGISALVKICALAIRDGTSLDPAANPRLAGQLAEMLADAPDHPAYAASSLVQEYLRSHTSPVLSAAESRLLDLLQSRLGQLVTKDQICETVYPDVKNRAGISDHALDQLVHRLRTKLTGRHTLTTHRGLGYVFDSDSGFSSKHPA